MPPPEEIERFVQAADERRARRAARESLLDFARYVVPTYQISRPHEQLANRLERIESGEIKRLMVNMPRRHGKQLADSTPMLTANRGWTTHGELAAGDFVFGLDGQPVAVVAVSEPAMQDCCVEFDNRSRLFAHENHEWLVEHASGRREVVETKDLEAHQMPSRPSLADWPITTRGSLRVKSVTRVPKVLGRCIQVDAEDGVYLAGYALIPTHNSLLVSQIFPCWIMGRRPRIRVVQCGYAESLTCSHSRKARDLFATEQFHNVFPKVTHRPGTEGQKTVAVNRQTAHEWGTEDGGSYYAVGVGGGLAGRGFHCLTSGTIIETDAGPCAIENLQMKAPARKVLGYDTSQRTATFQKVQAIASREVVGIYRITTASGRVVEATGEHPFWTGDGYTNANLLAPGDALLLAVREGSCADGVPFEQAHEARSDTPLLQSSLFRAWGEPEEREIASQVPCLRGKNTPKQKILRSGVQGRVVQSEDGEVLGAIRNNPVQDVREANTRSKPAKQKAVLLAGVCKPKSCATNDKVWQSKLEKGQDRALDGIKNSQQLSEDSTTDCSQGLPRMRGLRQQDQSACSSHRHESRKQHLGKSGDAVQGLPCEMAWCGAFKTEVDTVALVEKVCQRTVVWNLQVEGTQNFFANGILTHNCGIIDDFYKSRSEANSVTVRDKVHDWYRSVFYPAQDEDDIFPGAAIIVTATRWHTSDLTAQILKDAQGGKEGGKEDWEELSLPAIDGDGQALWPERWNLEKLARIKAAIGSREFSAQYQQNPRDVEGGLFQREWFDGKYLNERPADMGQPWTRYWDLAGTEKSAKAADPDWTVGCLGTMISGIFYICEMRRFRATELVIQNAICQCAESDPQGTRIRIEQEPGSGSKNLIAGYQRMLPGVDLRGVPSVGDKVTRAGPLSAYAEAGNVRLVRGAWNEAFLNEAELIPNGDHDDTIDGASGCFTDLTNRGGTPQAESVPLPGRQVSFERGGGVYG